MNRTYLTMKHTKTFILLAFSAFMLFACSKEETTPEPQQPSVPQIILDTDIASSTDDLFAMQLLYRDEVWAERMLNLIRASNR